MDFQIINVILWPHSPSVAPHRHVFEPGKLNIITGASKTGKSALIPVIDYCLGSSQCAIPVGAIRNKCSWYGVLIQIGDERLLLARKNPGKQAQSGDMLMRRGASLDIPASISDEMDGRVNALVVKKELNRLAKLTNLELSAENAQRFAAPPGFRDLLAFSYQPQNIVANPYALFFRADLPRYRERLRVIFPYALGALTDQDVQSRWELQTLEPQLRRLDKQIEDQRAVSDRWKADINGTIAKARSLGLLSPEITDPATADEGLKLLRGVVRKSASDARPSKRSLEVASVELSRVEQAEKLVVRELGTQRRRRDELIRLQENLPGLENLLKAQKNRLELSRWMLDEVSHDGSCPLCGSAMPAQSDELVQLTGRLSDIEAQIEDIAPQPQEFAQELKNVSKSINALADRLTEVRIIKGNLLLQSEELAEIEYESEQAAKFLGELNKALEIYSAAEVSSDLMQRKAELLGQVEALRNRVSDEAVKARLSATLHDVSVSASGHLADLNAEHTDWPISIDPSELTVHILSPDGDRHALWQIGSGANWLAYHIATTVSLQAYFVKDIESPVPSFLVYDQPSQVYFPRATLVKEEDGEDFEINQEDLLAVRSIFKTLSDAVTNAEGSLQVIVLDHARQEVWSGLKNVHVVGEWRHGKKLVPDSWADAHFT